MAWQAKQTPVMTPHKPVVQIIITGQPRNNTVVEVVVIVFVIVIFVFIVSITVILTPLVILALLLAVIVTPEFGVSASETGTPLARTRN